MTILSVFFEVISPKHTHARSSLKRWPRSLQTAWHAVCRLREVSRLHGTHSTLPYPGTSIARNSGTPAHHFDCPFIAVTTALHTHRWTMYLYMYCCIAHMHVHVQMYMRRCAHDHAYAFLCTCAPCLPWQRHLKGAQ